MNKGYYRHKSAFIKLIYSDGTTYLNSNTEKNRKALINEGFELILLTN